LTRWSTHRKGKYWKGGTLGVGSIGRGEPWSLGRGVLGKVERGREHWEGWRIGMVEHRDLFPLSWSSPRSCPWFFTKVSKRVCVEEICGGRGTGS